MIHVLYLEADALNQQTLLEQARLFDMTAVAASTFDDALIVLQQKQADALCIGHSFPAYDALQLRRRLEQQAVRYYPLPDAETAEAQDGLLSRIKSTLRQIQQDCAKDHTKVRERQPNDFYEFVGVSEPMQEVYAQIRKVADTDVPVLLVGESGTGKELAARALHWHSSRGQHAYFPVNCAALSPQLIDSELFGHEKGSFTGADKSRQGYFDLASEGTLFLDEITEMPAPAQARLLRVLENGEFMKVGGSELRRSTARIIAASNRSPVQAVQDKILREDLYYRLSAFPLFIPPLRERGDDIARIALNYLQQLNQQYQSSKQLSQASLTRFGGYGWPGNVRELRHVVLRGFILCEGQEIDVDPMQGGLPATGIVRSLKAEGP